MNPDQQPQGVPTTVSPAPNYPQVSATSQPPAAPAQQNFDPMTGQPLQTPVAAGPTSKSRRWMRWLLLWILAWPVAFILSLISHFIVRQPLPAVTTTINIITILLGLYGMLGWIPMVIAMIRENRQ